MTKKISVPRGTADILPTDVSLWQDIEKSARKLFKLYNYKEIRTPVYEETGLFQRSLGATSDVVNKQLLQLAGDKKEGYALRPEGTASIVRSYIQNGMDRKESLSKLFYIGPMFRGERPQKGRLRQFHQIGAEAIGIGIDSPLVDAEMILLSVRILKAIGLEGFTVKVNTLGTDKDKEKFAKVLKEELKDKKKKLCDTCQDRYDRNVLRILDCKSKECQSLVDSLDIGDSYLSKESKLYFDKVCSSLDAQSVEYEICPKLVRGLDYYSHTVYEISDSSLGSQDALGAGGRYNRLLHDLGADKRADFTAMGFALGIERMILALGEQKERPSDLDVFIVSLDEESNAKAFEILNVLRGENIVADMSFKTSSMKSQMRVANKMQSKKVLILGSDELKRNCVTVKNMETSEQSEIDISNNNFENLINKFKEER